mmetsp:Transcript_20792/g.24419  ORF Transcript_20792/g.24419 Transcript_20792/m.24419 type:complete len:287 (-) Transcript_20792:109-969(-)
MKTFALVLLMAGFAAAKDLPPTDVDAPTYDDDTPKPAEDGTDATQADGEIPAEGEAADEGVEPDLEPEETWEEYWERFGGEMLMARMGWQGVYQGLYGIAGEDDAPTDDCFGDWIPEKMKEVSAFRETVAQTWSADFDQAATVAYDIIDLVFLNDKYCHFRKAIWDLHDFCAYGTSCGSDMVFDNMQKNAFNIITQVSSTASIMKEQKWEDMDTHHRAYTLNQIGHSVASLVADMISFDPENIPLPPPPEEPKPEEPAEGAEGDEQKDGDDSTADSSQDAPEIVEN